MSSKSRPKDKQPPTVPPRRDVPKPAITDDELQELRMAFRLLDRNKDGRISVSEFQLMLKNFGINVPDEMVQEFINSKSRSGSLTENDFIGWVGSSVAAIPDDASKDLMAAFRVFDKDGNGFITRDELKEAMEMIGEPVTDEDIDNMITMADLNKDGKIDYEEFSKLLG
ncbi:unnamed protein product [Orchesella dallaii]|uniref:EF-hand domain-containing protein n=1 Tax=Orchesella dallaii TaxID=48710 RepID=A0ABP1QTI1_9HEXA